MFAALRPILNRGGAGHYATRAESAERLLPIADEHLRLLATYNGVLDATPAGPVRERLEGLMPFFRTEVSKISETLLSYGVVAPNGVGVEPEALGSTETERFRALLERERTFGNLLRGEVDAVHHQERTRAILGHNAEASNRRLDALRDLTSATRR